MKGYSDLMQVKALCGAGCEGAGAAIEVAPKK